MTATAILVAICSTLYPFQVGKSEHVSSLVSETLEAVVGDTLTS